MSVSLATPGLPLLVSFSFLVVVFRCPSLYLAQTTAGPDICTSLDGLRTYNCTSRQCLTCFDSNEGSNEISQHPARCTLDTNSSTLHCVPDTSSCTVETCKPCEHCQAIFQPSPGRSLLDSDWQFISHCFELRTHRETPDCESNEIFYADRCVGVLLIEPNERDTFLNGHLPALPPTCSCTEPNCTGLSAEIRFEFVPDPPPPPTAPPGMTTAGDGSTTTGNTTTDATATGDPIAAYLVAIIAIVGAIVSLIMIIAIIVMVWRCKRTKSSESVHSGVVRARRRAGPSEESSDQPWELINQIGHGRYGYVYKAVYNNDIVAIKMFSHNSRSAWETECTLNSMESTTHKNIVEFITSGRTHLDMSSHLYIITKYYPLGSLNQFLQKHVVTLEQACVMISDIATGLAHLHSEYYTNSGGIVAEKYAIAHRDMKSANVLVKRENGECVIGDLGFAMILDPSLDSKQLASTGQVGTFRYMAPEVLDTRVHLQDLQSFKQIDIYAFSLIMWEVMSRCCILNAEDVPDYRLPFQEEVGLRPSLDTMKDLVVTEKLRPSLPPLWANDELLIELRDTLVECWDGDPEARLSAANIVYRMEEFVKTMNQVNEEEVLSSGGHAPQYQPITTATTYMSDTIDSVTGQIGRPTEYSQSSPPPYYSPTDPNSYSGVYGSSSQQQHFFPTSMPHISQESGCGQGGVPAGSNRPMRTLRNSACSDGGTIRMNRYNSDEPMSVRNSLILGSVLRGEVETNFGVSSGGGASLLYERVLEIQGENDGSSIENVLSNDGSVAGLDSEEFNLNSDSGVPNAHSGSVTSVSSDSHSDSSESLNSMSSSRLSDELFSKRQLPESSTDTLDLDLPPAAVSHYGGAPAITTTNQLDLTGVSQCGDDPVVTSTNNEVTRVATAENSGNSVSTVTSV